MTIEGLSAPKRVTITYRDGTTEELPLEDIPFRRDLSYELAAFTHMIHEGGEDAYNDRTRISLEVMDEARAQMGMHFPNDDIL